MEKIHDVTVVGAGPVGLFTTFYSGMRGASTHLIDSLPEVGGQLAALYPEKYIYDIAGFPKIKAQALVDQLYEQAQIFSPDITLGEQVLNVDKLGEQLFEITTTKKVYRTKNIIITAGAGAFEHRKLEVEHAEKYEGSQIHYYINELEAFRDKNVVLLGGGDSAIDWALALEPIAKKVTLVHRRNRFRAHEASVEQLTSSSVNVLTPYEVTELVENERALTGVKLKKVRDEEEITLDADEVVVNFGFITDLGPLKSWGIEIERNSIKVNQQTETNIEGIYSAGDICIYKGKPKLIATGFGEATVAVNGAKLRLDPEARVTVHSTHLFEEMNV